MKRNHWGQKSKKKVSEKKPYEKRPTQEKVNRLLAGLQEKFGQGIDFQGNHAFMALIQQVARTNGYFNEHLGKSAFLAEKNFPELRKPETRVITTSIIGKKAEKAARQIIGELATKPTGFIHFFRELDRAKSPTEFQILKSSEDYARYSNVLHDTGIWRKGQGIDKVLLKEVLPILEAETTRRALRREEQKAKNADQQQATRERKQNPFRW
ncbi:MAG: hypothetical protein J4224_00525 [Candidatus Diapherotrites archaeon]|uniref:Uncharacterized protein n=1 Tax=Candidatus Iainarchaeum sp. TaxID=3101447 RepID=A0A7J4IWS1_9ARCH|nr:MAG: hypothetical protein QT03_C0001G0471 [archaeon GW2011_AR10]MBS3058893.1 hypothetical protein [Candidatus Diapherotrites archaeon]HIH08729.1 hypothetical protein [Candidatus Diapherotrites archaeon]